MTERAAKWNNWSEEETNAIGRTPEKQALQEWNLLNKENCSTNEELYKLYIHAWLDPGNQTLATLDFFHAVQGDSESEHNRVTALSIS